MDSGQFDGSCDPNPGGRMGCGWHFTVGGKEYTNSAEYSPAPDNSNNQAEWRALINLLEGYLAAGGKGPLEVRGDSKLVINQIKGAWAVRAEGLRAHLTRARALAGQISGGVTFQWVPRSSNAVADRLASGKPAAAAPSQVFAAKPQDVPPLLASEIAALNASGQDSFKAMLGLRVGGTDRMSSLREADLEPIAGAECVALVKTAFPGDESDARRSRESAYRWIARGLEAHLAIRKAQVDREIAGSMRQRRS